MGVPDRIPPTSPAPLARAVRSPLPALAAVAGGGIVLLGGGGATVVAVTVVLCWVVATVVRALAYAGRTGGPARRDRIDPFGVGEPWRRFVKDAVQGRNRFDEAVSRTPPGPLRDRLVEVGERLASGVDEIWRIAQQGHALAGARRDLGPGQLRRRLEALESGGRSPDPASEASARALRAQLDAVERLDVTIADAEARLRILDARLSEAVTRSIELSVQTAGTAAVDALDDDVEGVVGDLEALRQALEEMSQPPRGGR
jgi:hypothetical protein